MTNYFDSKYLLPSRFRTAGIILFIPAFILLIVRFYLGIKLEIFNFKVFAVYSSYLDTKYFRFVDNHFSEEIGGILLLAAMLFICFAREKVELDSYNQIRFKSLLISFYVNSIFLIISFLTVFGFGFVRILIANIYTPFIIYFLIFKFNLIKSQKLKYKSEKDVSISN